MIAKLIKGKGFRGALEYDLQTSKGYCLDSNMAGDSPRELAKEFGAIRALRPNLAKAVCHVSVSLHPKESLTDEQWKEVAQTYLKGMGFNDNQYVVTKHTDTSHPHIHILANRISMKGEVVSDSKDYQRQEAIMRRLEKEYGLEQVAPSHESTRKAPTKGEVECAVRTGVPSAKGTLQVLVDAASQGKPKLDEFTKRLEKEGVQTILNKAQTGRISGISFQHNNITMKGSDLGRGYSWAGLQKRGVQYEQDRISVSQGFQRSTAALGRTDAVNGGSAHGESEERGRTGTTARTLGSIHVQPDRNDKAERADHGNPYRRNYGQFLGATEGGQRTLARENGISRESASGTLYSAKENNPISGNHTGSNASTSRQHSQNESRPERGPVGVPDTDSNIGGSALNRISLLADAGLRYADNQPKHTLLQTGRAGEKNSASATEHEKVTSKGKEEDLEL